MKLRLTLAVVLSLILVDYFTGVLTANLLRLGWNLQAVFAFLTSANAVHYFGKRSFPVAVFTAYLYHPYPLGRHATFILDVLALSLVGVTIWLLRGYVSGLLFNDYTGFRWQYVSSVQWLTGFQLLYFMFRRFVGNALASLNMAVSSVWGFGWLHEILLFHPLKLFVHPSHLLYVHTQLVTLVILASFLLIYFWRWSSVSLAGFTFFVAYSVFADPMLHSISYVGNFPLKGLVQFVDRLPAMAAMLTLPWGFKRG